MCGCLPFQTPCSSHRCEYNLGNWPALFDHSLYAHFSSFEKCPCDEKQISELVHDAKHSTGHSPILHFCLLFGNDRFLHSNIQSLDHGLPGNKHTFISFSSFFLHLHLRSHLENASSGTESSFEGTGKRKTDISNLQALRSSGCNRFQRRYPAHLHCRRRQWRFFERAVRFSVALVRFYYVIALFGVRNVCAVVHHKYVQYRWTTKSQEDRCGTNDSDAVKPVTRNTRNAVHANSDVNKTCEMSFPNSKKKNILIFNRDHIFFLNYC